MKIVSSTLISARVSSALCVALLVSLCPIGMAFAADEAAPAADQAQVAVPAPVVSSTAKIVKSTDAGIGRIAVVDVSYLINSSKAGKSIRTQLDKQRDAYRGQIDKQEGELQEAEKNLMAQQDTLPKDQFLQKRKEFQEKVTDAQHAVQLRRAAFDKAYTDAMEKLREAIVKIVADAAGKNKIALVLNRQEVVLVEEKMDMTKQILATLDSTITSIPVNVK